MYNPYGSRMSEKDYKEFEEWHNRRTRIYIKYLKATGWYLTIDDLILGSIRKGLSNFLNQYKRK